MKILLATFFSIILFFAKADEGKEIYFQNISYKQALELSKVVGKNIFMHGFSDWCEHCKKMNDEVYTDSEVGNFFNSHFICIKVDMEKEGSELKKQLRISKYPALVFFNSSGETVHRVSGEYPKSSFLKIGNDAIDTTKQLVTFQKKFESGTATYVETYTYLRMLERAAMSTQNTLTQYFSKVLIQDLTKPENWRLIADFLNNSKSQVMDLLLYHKKAFEEKFTTDTVNNKIMMVFLKDLAKRVQLLDSIGFENMKTDIRNKNLDIANKICDYGDMVAYHMKDDYPHYFNAAIPYLEKYGDNDIRRIGEITTLFAERCSDIPLLAKAEKWAKHAVELQDTYKTNLSLAGISFKLKNKQQALDAANHAIELAQKSGTNYQTTSLLIEKINEETINEKTNTSKSNTEK